MIDLDSKEHRVLILTPLGADAELAHSILGQSAIRAEICESMPDLLSHLKETYGAILVADEALDHEGIEALNAALREQEPWSDIPLVLLTTGGAFADKEERIWSSFAATGNVTLLERPVRTSTLISALQVALRARRRQYQVRKLLEDQKNATHLRDEFISIASHELKTPITSMKLQLQIQDRALEKGDIPRDKLKKFVRVKSQQVERLIRLVEDMLDVSRIHSGKFNIQREEFDLACSIQETIDRLREQLMAANCHVYFSAQPCVGEWDRLRLEQVIVNLFTNAMRYAPGSALTLSLTRRDEEVTLTFDDEGPGIAESDLERVFERFERTGGGKGISGLGLGLYICRQIAKAHGGNICAVKKDGPGARFVLQLPIRNRAESSATAGLPMGLVN